MFQVKPLAAIAVLIYGIFIMSEAAYGAISEESSEENILSEVNDAEAYYALLKIHTGYPNHSLEVPIQITEDFVQLTRRNKQRDLICTYLHNGLIYMELTKFLFDAHIHTEYAAEDIAKYSWTVQNMLSSLYEIGALKSKAIMSFYLYINLMNRYPKSVDWDGKSRQISFDRAVDIHLNVLQRLRDEFGRCPKLDHPDYDNFMSEFHEKKVFDDETSRNSYINAILKPIGINYVKVFELINKNIDERGDKYYSRMSFQNIFINYLGKGPDVYNLKLEFDRDFNWGVVGDTILSRLTDAQRLHLDKDSLELLISYQIACIDYLKIIMLRFKLKFLEFLKELRLLMSKADRTEIGNRSIIENGNVQKWHVVLTDFIEWLHLENGKFFNDLLLNLKGNSFDLYLIGVNDTIKECVESELDNILKTTFKGSAFIPIVLDVESEDISIVQNQLEYVIDKARLFVNYMKNYLSTDFRIIQTIIGLKNKENDYF